ncbi:MAG: thiolase family protein, partial [Anaerolineae bacterium]|nr:thiolase family protein [Anaerolineae bacterium]
ENMSQAPYAMYGGREGFRFGTNPKLEDTLFGALYDPLAKLAMAQTAEKVAKTRGISREAQDEYALRSHRLGAEAVKEGRFGEEIEPVRIETRRGELVIDTDDHIKPDTSAEALAKLRPAFGKDGTVTAGNASGIVDGAAAVIVTTAGVARELDVKPLARLVSWGIAGVSPDIMGIGPAPATRIALKRAGMTLANIGLFEINEAFAAQCLACARELDLDTDILNVNGGAISIGHPLGATGTRLVLTLLKEMQRRGVRYGSASMCIGGGMGAAGIFELIN